MPRSTVGTICRATDLLACDCVTAALEEAFGGFHLNILSQHESTLRRSEFHKTFNLHSPLRLLFREIALSIPDAENWRNILYGRSWIALDTLKQQTIVELWRGELPLGRILAEFEQTKWTELSVALAKEPYISHLLTAPLGSNLHRRSRAVLGEQGPTVLLQEFVDPR